MGSRHRFSCLLTLTALALATPSVFGAEGDLLPFALAVDVGYGEPGGPEFIRTELEQELVRTLEESRCFSSIGPLRPGEGPSPDLVLTVLLDDYRDRLDYEISLAARDAPNAMPETERRVVAKLRAEIHVALTLEPDALPVRTRQYRKDVAYRPKGGEDPHYAVQTEFVDEVALSVRKIACKGSEKKLDKEIRAARAAVAEEDDTSR